MLDDGSRTDWGTAHDRRHLSPLPSCRKLNWTPYARRDARCSLSHCSLIQPRSVVSWWPGSRILGAITTATNTAIALMMNIWCRQSVHRVWVYFDLCSSADNGLYACAQHAGARSHGVPGRPSGSHELSKGHGLGRGQFRRRSALISRPRRVLNQRSQRRVEI